MTLHLSETVVIRDEDIEERFIRGQGTRGQNPRHKSTAVELRYDVAHADLPEDVKTRLRQLGGRRVTAEGILVIASRRSASQKVNRDAAHDRLLSLLLRASYAIELRKPTRPRRAVRARRVAEKRIQGHVKALRHTISDEDLRSGA